MAKQGTLGHEMSAENSYVQLYQITAAPTLYATISVNLVNTGTTPTTDDSTVRIAITPATISGTPVDAAYMNNLSNLEAIKKYHIEFGALLTANGGVIERTCIPVSPGEKIFVWASNSKIAARVFGLEQS
jgi:hypothetical protein